MKPKIIFDLSEVLFWGFRGFQRQLAKLPCHMPPGITYYIEPGRLHLHAAMLAFFRGELSERQMWNALIIDFGWNIRAERLEAMIREQFDQVPGTIDIAARLKDEGYELSILSVHGKEWIAHLEKEHHFSCLFSERIYSFSKGFLKPDQKSYEQALEVLGAEARECLFIDDSPANIAAADRLGFETHLFTEASNLRKHLYTRGLLKAP